MNWHVFYVKKALVLYVLIAILMGLTLYGLKTNDTPDSNKEKAVIVLLNESNFKEETASGIVLVDFYADWCAPCKAIAPILENLTDVKVGKVDIEVEQKLASDYKVSAIPLLIFFKDGEEMSRLTGLHKQESIQKVIDELK